MTKLELFPLKTNIICSNDDLVSVFSSALDSHDLSLQDNDVIVIVSKVVTVVQGGIIDLSTLTPSSEAQSLALQTGLPPEMVELALSESLELISKGILLGSKNEWRPIEYIFTNKLKIKFLTRFGPQ